MPLTMVPASMPLMLGARSSAPQASGNTNNPVFDGAQGLLLDQDNKEGAFLDGGAVCGFVNSKNGFGVYAGLTRYVTAGAVDATIIESSYGGDFEKVWTESCTRVSRFNEKRSGKAPR